MKKYTDNELIQRHITKNIGNITTIFQEIISDDLHIDIAHVKSTLLRRYEVLVTMGTSAKAMTVPDDVEGLKYLELLMLLPKGWPLTTEAFQDEAHYWPIRLLKDLARFVHHGNTWFGFGHTVANAQAESSLIPYAKNTRFCACVLLPSITLGESVCVLERIPESENIGFLSVIPIYEQELTYKIDHGIDPLLDLFDKYRISDRLDIARRPVVG